MSELAQARDTYQPWNFRRRRVPAPWRPLRAPGVVGTRTVCGLFSSALERTQARRSICVVALESALSSAPLPRPVVRWCRQAPSDRRDTYRAGVSADVAHTRWKLLVIGQPGRAATLHVLLVIMHEPTLRDGPSDFFDSAFHVPAGDTDREQVAGTGFRA